MIVDLEEIEEMQADRVILLTPSQFKYYRLRQQGYGVREIARMCSVSAATVCRTLKTAERNIRRQRGAEDNGC